MSYFSGDGKRTGGLKARFPGSELVGDVLLPGFVRLSWLHPVVRAAGAHLHWSLADSHTTETWRPGTRLLGETFYCEQTMHVNRLCTLDTEAILADSEPFDEFEA